MIKNIDAWIAEHVMGHIPDDTRYNFKSDRGWYCIDDWSPSTDIKAAFEVAEKLKLYDITSRTYDTPKKHRSYACIFYEKGGGIMAYAKTLPMAICLAALKAKGIEVTDEQD